MVTLVVVVLLGHRRPATVVGGGALEVIGGKVKKRFFQGGGNDRFQDLRLDKNDSPGLIQLDAVGRQAQFPVFGLMVLVGHGARLGWS